MRDLVACLALAPRAATLLLVWLLELLRQWGFSWTGAAVAGSWVTGVAVSGS
jgi:hypothetical protein